MAVRQEGEGCPRCGVGVVDEAEDCDGFRKPLFLDEGVDGGRVLSIFYFKISVHGLPVLGLQSAL